MRKLILKLNNIFGVPHLPNDILIIISCQIQEKHKPVTHRSILYVSRFWYQQPPQVFSPSKKGQTNFMKWTRNSKNETCIISWSQLFGLHLLLSACSRLKTLCFHWELCHWMSARGSLQLLYVGQSAIEESTHVQSQERHPINAQVQIRARKRGSQFAFSSGTRRLGTLWMTPHALEGPSHLGWRGWEGPKRLEPWR